jgi:alcohol dehydrogenase
VLGTAIGGCVVADLPDHCANNFFASRKKPLTTPINLLQDWTLRLNLKSLGHFGVKPEDLPKIVANARGNSMQTNPIRLTDAEIAAIVLARI